MGAECQKQFDVDKERVDKEESSLHDTPEPTPPPPAPPPADVR